MKVQNRAITVVALALAAALGGCTTQAWYEGAKVGAQNECRKQPPGAAEECLARANKKTYEQYEKERSTK
jgi:hypothetical protein